MDTTYQFAELFNSFEGEFPYQGRRATFIRFAKCNLKCEWCDTMNGQSALPLQEYKSSEIVEHVKDSRLITFTGGEPSLYIDEMMDIISLILSENNIYLNQITVETNGVELDKFNTLYNHLTSIGINNPNKMLTTVWSPKLYSPQLRSLALSNLYDSFNPSNMVIKLVSEPTDLSWISEEFIPNAISAHGIKNAKNICIMFKTNKESKYDEQNVQQTLQIASKYNICISTRIHLEHNFK